MSWVTGVALCVTTAGWVYGETLCFTTESVVKPTEAWIRVTRLIHRWSPGNYTLAIGLGDLTPDFDIPDWIKKERPSWMEPTPGPTPPPEGCVYQGNAYTEGSMVCMGPDLFACMGGRWVLAESGAPQCAGVGVTCSYQGVSYLPGTTKCIGNDYCVCWAGEWKVLVKNHPLCRGS